MVSTWHRLGEMLRILGGGDVCAENTQRQYFLLQMGSLEFLDDL